MTNRRFFVGPIPEGWLQGHRKSWYKSRLRLRNYTSQAISFSAGPVATHYSEQDNQPGPSVPDLDEEVALTLTNTDNATADDVEIEVQEEQSEEEDESEPVGELRTLTHPEAEISGDDPLPEEHADSAEGAWEDEGSEQDSGEDTDSTVKARSSTQDDVYHNDLASSSFVTARENISSSADTGESVATLRANGSEPPGVRSNSQGSYQTTVAGETSRTQLTPNPSMVPSEADSTTQLLRTQYKDKGKQRSKASGVSMRRLSFSL